MALNLNTVSAPHSHPGNSGRSRGFAIGAYDGGQFHTKGKTYDVSKRLLEFDGTISHGSKHFQGLRLSVVAYTLDSFAFADANDKLVVRSLGFLVPGDAIRCLKLQTNFFWDLFSGENSPFAAVAKSEGFPTFDPVDCHPKVGGKLHDVTDPLLFDFLLRLAWSGSVRLAAASPPCSAYSRLREYPEGPRAIRYYDCLEPREDLTQRELD